MSPNTFAPLKIAVAISLALVTAAVSAEIKEIKESTPYTKDSVIDENITEMIFDIPEGKHGPYDNDRFSFGNKKVTPAEISIKSSDLTVINKQSEVLFSAKLTGNGNGNLTLKSEGENGYIMGNGHNEVIGFNEANLISTQSNAIFSGGGGKNYAKVDAKKIHIEGNSHAIYVDETTQSDPSAIEITGFDELSLKASVRYAVRNVGSDKQTINITGNQDSTAVFTGGYGAVSSEKIGNGSGDSSIDISVGKIQLQSTNTRDGVLNNTAGDITFNTNALTVINESTSGAAIHLTGGNLQINGFKDNTDTVLKVQGNVSTSGTATANLNFNSSDSYLQGAINNTADNVNIAFTDQATWTTDQSSNSKNLTLDKGIINLTGTAEQKVEIDELKGSGGTINLSVTKDGEKLSSGSLTATTVADTWMGATVNLVGDLTTDELKNPEAEISGLLSNVSPDILKNGTGSVGGGDLYSDLAFTVDENGQLHVGTKTASDKITSLSDGLAVTQLQWRHEMNNLTKRMGELRDSPDGIGAWTRVYGSEQEYGKTGVDLKSASVQVGADYRIGDWVVGGAFNYTDGNVTYRNGTGDTDSYGFAVYGTWLASNGMFVDLIGKYSRLSNDFEIANMKGSLDNNAWSVSAEFGWRFDLNSIAYIEPQAELTYGRILGDTSTASNDVRIEQDDFNALLGRVGVRAGLKFPDNKGSIYARLSGVHDFEGESDATYTKGDNVVKLHDDIGGSWVEYAIGANFNLTPSTYTYVDLERTSGGEVKENWRWNVGLRTVF